MNDARKIFGRGGLVALSTTLVATVGLFFAVQAEAQDITMADGGSTATINLGGGTGNLGMNGWNVSGQNQLNQQWFWYSMGGGVAQTIDNISAASTATASGGDGINDLLATYANNTLTVNIEYVLTGNGVGSGSADLQEYISLVNNTASPLTLSFYQYSNFNLLQDNANSVSISGSPGAYNGALQTTSSGGGSGIAEVIDAPSANYGEANYADGSVNSTLYKLNNTAGLILNDTTSAGPGDVTWGFQWNTTIDPGQTFYITKDKGLSISIVPEPSSLAFIGLGLTALAFVRRRRSN